MIGNSLMPGVATEPRHRDRHLENQVINALDHALKWAAEACVPGEYSETLLPAQLWAIDAAAAELQVLEKRERKRLYAEGRGRRDLLRLVDPSGVMP